MPAKKYTLFIFSILVFSLTPQSVKILPYVIRIGNFDVHTIDLLTGAVFIPWVLRILVKHGRQKITMLKADKMYIAFLIVGLIPVLVGAVKGKSNLFFVYRFFFYFIWVPVLIRFLRNPNQANRVVHVLVVVNLCSVAVALFNHFKELGLRIFYLDMHHELNLFVCIVLLSLVLARKPLFKSKVLTLIAFLICVFAISIDGSRKIFLGMSIGTILLFAFIFWHHPRDKTFLLKVSVASIAAMFMLSAVCGDKAWNHARLRYQSIFVMPSTDVIEQTTDVAIGFRLYAIKCGLEVIKQHPIVGLGGGGQIELNEKINAGVSLFRYGFPSGYRNPNPHNCYISILVYCGIPIACWISFVIYRYIRFSFYSVVQNIRGGSRAPVLALGMILGFIAFLTAMFFEGFAVKIIVDFWIFIGLALGFSNLSYQKQSEKSSNLATG